MTDRQSHALCYNCDEKWVRGHKCKEKKLFQIDTSSPPTYEEHTFKEPKETLEDTPTPDEEELEVQQE